MNIPNKITTKLEDFIDHAGLMNILEIIDIICQEKAEHISLNWQDNTTAKAWKQAGNAIGKLAVSQKITEVSS